jgi:hypothetical protein
MERTITEFLAAFKDLQVGAEFQVADMVKKLHWGKTKCYEMLGRLQERGHIVDSPERGMHELVSKEPEPVLELPEKPRLNADGIPHFRQDTLPIGASTDGFGRLNGGV